ncbi:sensor histidine kinase [Streptomyces sp. NBC_01351]|uniref:sensor histidine kinase n=1 Tax=Streptomyces sp. NBC_01351 TaxID=2903833 RepID=UPI002E34D5A1|nr:sensor histidine kinase [Streptomyces sp. NBC_01351]
MAAVGGEGPGDTNTRAYGGASRGAAAGTDRGTGRGGARGTTGGADRGTGQGADRVTDRALDAGADRATARGADQATGQATDQSTDAGADLGAEAPVERSAWTRNDALVAVGAAATDLIGFSLGARTDGGSLTMAIVPVLSALPLLVRRTHPVAALAAVLALGVVLNLATPLAPHFPLTLVVALYSVARSCRPTVAVASALAAVPLISAGQSGWPVPFGWQGLLANAFVTVLVVGAAEVVNRRQQEAEAHRRLLADRALAEERRRIARELHDIVAHHITTMQLMAGGARANLAYDPEAAREALVTLEGSGRLALREMRQLLDVLRAGEEPEDTPPAPQPGAGDLDRIVAEARLAGTRTEFTVDGPVRPLPPTVGLTVFRIVQEALTNTRKHAGRARARVRLTYGPDEVAVEVRDDGGGAQAPAATRPGHRSGYGLIGMRERVALQGGTLEAVALDAGGFRVAARLPTPPDGLEPHQPPHPPQLEESR